MISFYPGPSRTQSNLPDYLLDACKSGILSENHRSEAFIALSKACILNLKTKLSIPDDYWVFFTSSATECWHILADSFQEISSYHIFNGAFGEKWYEMSKQIKGNVDFYKFGMEEEVDLSKIPVGSSIICITQNETSNGTEISMETLLSVRKRFPDSLVMVDATSSMGGIALDFAAADVWFASVQKCFGLPAGMGILICSPKAIETALKLDHRISYNSLVHLHDKMKIWQTPYTPNVLGIYLLLRVMEDMKDIHIVEKNLKIRAKEYYDFFSNNKTFHLLVNNSKVRSNTVIALKSDESNIRELKIAARKKDILLGNGYGELSKNTVRIANFPSMLASEIGILKTFFQSY